MHISQPSPLSARFFTTSVSCVTAALPMCAAESAPPLAASALVAEALASHPELRLYEVEVAAAKAGRRSAGTRACQRNAVETGAEVDGLVEITDGLSKGDSVVTRPVEAALPRRTSRREGRRT